MYAIRSYYDSPGNHGLAWPVTNEKLKFQTDREAVNAYPETEFLSRVIDKAHTLNIEVFIEIKYLGLAGVREGYPGIDFKRRQDGTLQSRVRPEAGLVERESINDLNKARQQIAGLKSQLESHAKNGMDEAALVNRITSYNVCYTKLLRLAAPLKKSGYGDYLLSLLEHRS